MREHTDPRERAESVERPRETDAGREVPTRSEVLRAAYDADIGGAREPRDVPERFVVEHVTRIRAAEAEDLRRFHGLHKHVDAQEPQFRERLEERKRSHGVDKMRVEGLEHVTGFRSKEAFAMAEARAWRYAEAMGLRRAAEAQGRFVFGVDLPARTVLGKRFQDHVHGMSLAEDDTIGPTRFDDQSSVSCSWMRTRSGEWVVSTNYPDPRRKY